MNMNEKKEKLINQEISVFDLTNNEVKQLKDIVRNDLEKKKKELDNLNQKIKDMKTKIDNWAN